jgi:hypothetical protein
MHTSRNLKKTQQPCANNRTSPNQLGLRVSYMKKPLTMTAKGVSFGAGEMNRTPDLLITNELLYRLSYTGFGLRL